MRFIGYIGISGTLLLAEFFLHSYEADFIQTLVREKIKTLAVAYYSPFRYIDEVLSINNSNLHINVYSIYTSELEIKGTTKSASSLAFLDMLLEKDIDVNLTKVMTSFYL